MRAASIARGILLFALVPVLAAAQSTPKTGAEVFQRMHDAYKGKWYHNLTFTQRTTQYRPDGTQTVSTWYESLRHMPDHGTQLRIDVGQPSAGNGMLYTADSTWRLKDGALARTDGQGNEFLPLIEGVYMQPVATTLAQLGGTGVDMSRVSTGTWDGRKAWIIGASSAADSTSPQIWIDASRKVVVRMILSPGANAPTMDIHLGKYEPLAGGWLATKVDMLVGGKPRQTEEYSGWKANIDLAPGLFEIASWTSAPHWAGRSPDA